MLLFQVEPKIMESPPDKRLQLFADKCQQICQVCDFTRTDLQKEEKTEKSEILMDVLGAVCDHGFVSQMTEKEYSGLYHAFRRNVIRTTPAPPVTWFAPISIDFTIDRVQEAGWDHISRFYDIILAFFSNRQFNPTFCQQDLMKVLAGIVSLFQSPDDRERDRVMKIFHCMYKTMKRLRSACRRYISEFLVAAVTSPFPRLGVAEILHALIPIIAGFKVPLHRENEDLFAKILLPLHISPHVHMWHTPLVSASGFFISKNSVHSLDLFDMLLTYWPVTSPTKQILYLNEIEALIGGLRGECPPLLLAKICKVIANVISSENFTLAERALMLWECDAFLQLIAMQSELTFPLLIPAIFQTATVHWCSDVKVLALNSMRVLKGCDVEMFESIGREFKQNESQRVMNELKHGRFWGSLIETYETSAAAREKKSKQLEQIFVGCEGISGQNSSGGGVDAQNVEMAVRPKGGSSAARTLSTGSSSGAQAAKRKSGGVSLSGMVKDNTGKPAPGKTNPPGRGGKR
jgi:serine/threonine-protein phosphatase 2A regulatory subunit B'